MDVIKSLAPTDACCCSWQKRHFPWTERVKEAVHSPALGYCELGGAGGEETGAPAVTVRRRTGAFHTCLRQGAGRGVRGECE